MLDMLPYQVPTSIVKQSKAPVINGPGHRGFKRLTKSQRAAFAVAVLRGEVGLQPTLGITSRALGVSITYIEAASKLSPEQLRRVRQGKVALADLKPAAAAPTPVKAEMTVADVAGWWWTASDADRAAVVGKVGVTSTWDALVKHLV
jgi:hypothetical protein